MPVQAFRPDLSPTVRSKLAIGQAAHVWFAKICVSELSPLNILMAKGLEITNQLQRHYGAGLPPVIQLGLQLVQSIPPKQPKLARLVLISMVQRLFLLLE